MKKILISVSIIAAAAAVVIGATTAYFSDTETSIGNTFTAGTIDIDIDDHNPFTGNFNIGDLKPGETGYMNFKINNVGTNPVNVFKKLYGFTPTDSKPNGYLCTASISGGTHNDYNTSSEPECVEEKGVVVNDVQTQIIYDLSVEVYKSPDQKIWWQTIYSDGEHKSLTGVYGDSQTVEGATPVALGMIPAGGYMLVTQSYHFNSDAGNVYQGDGLKFDIEIKGDQLNQSGGATVTLENKTGNPDWNIIETDNINGALTYQTKGPKFEYSFTGYAPVRGVSYNLIYASDPWPQKGILIDTKVSDSSTGAITMNGSKELGTDLPASGDVNTGAKIWLVLASDYTADHMTGWHPSSYLFETALINYDDTGL